jgi:hypothetical protein
MIRGRAIYFKVSYNIFTNATTMINFVISFKKIKNFQIKLDAFNFVF